MFYANMILAGITAGTGIGMATDESTFSAFILISFAGLFWLQGVKIIIDDALEG